MIGRVLMVFKNIRGSWAIAAPAWLFSTRVLLVKQDHPAYIPRLGLPLPRLGS
jgi:hypothetical protein